MQKFIIMLVLIASTIQIGKTLIPPTYVRNVVVDNQTSDNLKVLAKFQSSEGIYEIGPHQQLVIEKDVSMGSWSEVDPVQQIIINQDNRSLQNVFLQSPGGVVEATLVVRENHGNLLIQANYH